MGVLCKRPLCSFALALVAGILTGMPDAPPILRITAAVLAAAAALPGKRVVPEGEEAGRGACRSLPRTVRCSGVSVRKAGVRRGVLLALCAASFLAGYIRIRQEWLLSEAVEPLLTVTDDVELQGHIYKNQIKDKETVYYLDHVILRVEEHNYETHPVLVHLSDELSQTKKSLQLGTTAVFRGTLRQLRAAVNEGGYDEKRYYASLGIDYHLDAAEVLSVHGHRNVLAESLQSLSEKLKQSFIKVFSEENAGILSAMLLGDKGVLERETNALFQQAGVAHILVVSGMHMSCIGMCVYRLLRRRGGCLLSAGTAVAVLYLYGTMTCWGISAQRAFLMFLLSMLGKAAGRTYDVLTGLSLAVMFLLWENPMLIGNVGLQFSAAAILGVVLLAGQLRQIWELRRQKKRMHAVEKLRDVFCVSLGVQLGTLPLVLRTYYEVPLYGVLLNMLIVPLLGAVLCMGIICAGLGLVSLGVSQAAALPLELLLGAMRKAVALSLRLPGGRLVTGARSVKGIVLYYGVLVLLLFVVPHLLRQRNMSCVRRSGTGQGSLEVFHAIWRLVLAGGLLLLLAVFLRPVSDKKLCAFLDVGQGDGVYLQAENGTDLFLDGGSSSKQQLGSYTILPFLKYNGIGSIDYWLVSHYDTDHVSGLIEILEADYPIRCLVLPRRDSASSNYIEILELAEAKGIEILYLGQGDRLQLGEDTLWCLAPEGEEAFRETEGRTGEGEAPPDENESCLAIYYDGAKLQGIFAGDVGVDTEERILEKNPCLKRVDGTRLIVKADHHGSDYSNGELWLTALSPEYCVVSCGANNRYGHPGAEAVGRMEQAAREIHYTMEEGQISFYPGKDGLRVERFGINGE